MTSIPASSSRAVTGVRIAMCLLALVAMPVDAKAYIDPGTGSMLFQSLLAVLFGIGVGLRKVREWMGRAWTFIRRRPHSDDPRK